MTNDNERVAVEDEAVALLWRCAEMVRLGNPAYEALLHDEALCYALFKLLTHDMEGVYQPIPSNLLWSRIHAILAFALVVTEP